MLKQEDAESLAQRVVQEWRGPGLMPPTDTTLPERRFAAVLVKVGNRDMEGVPEGWKPADAWMKGGELVVCGYPEEPGVPDGDEGRHDCDAMGCSSVSHVLVRAPLLEIRQAVGDLRECEA